MLRRAVPLLAALCLLAPRAFAQDADPVLTIQAGAKKAEFKRSDLLKRPDLETLQVSADPAYPGKVMTYKAVPVAALFKDVTIAPDAVIQFKCLDGFSAPISKERLLNTDDKKSRAYVAIEETGAAWPPVKPNGPSAGPFYLVWPQPGLSSIGPEEWPFQLAAFEVKGSLAEVFPGVLPDAKASATVKQGFAVFTKNCFACHTLNKAGAAEVGPDLNVPMSVTEYLTKTGLRTIVRDPQAARHFPKSRMSAFPKEIISDKDLDALVAYLEHMAKRKVKK